MSVIFFGSFPMTSLEHFHDSCAFRRDIKREGDQATNYNEASKGHHDHPSSRCCLCQSIMNMKRHKQKRWLHTDVIVDHWELLITMHLYLYYNYMILRGGSP